MTETKPKRPWFKFSLRTLFVVITVLCIWLVILINGAREKLMLRRQKQPGERPTIN